MKKHIKYIAMLIILLAVFLPVAAFASDLSLESNKSQVAIGNTVSVTVTVSGEDMAIAQGVFDYDHTLLSYASSSGGASDGKLDMVSMHQGGASSLTAVIEFEALQSGEAAIEFSFDELIDYDGNTLDPCEGTIRITVLKDPLAAPTPDDDETLPEFTLEGIAAENVVGTDQSLFVWQSVLNLTLPSGFSDTEIIYNGHTVGGATDRADTPTVLLYLSDMEGDNAAFYVFDEEENRLLPYATIKSISQSFVILWPDEAFTVPEGYSKTILTLDGVEAPAWVKADSDAGIYLVYLRNASGERTLYQYMSDDQSLQRYIEEPTETENPDDLIITTLYIVCGLLFVAVIALIVMYVLSVKEKEAVITHSRQKLRELKKR